VSDALLLLVVFVKGDVMNIFEFAKEKEKYAEEFYRDRAAKSPDKGLTEIFLLLANEEEKHFELIEKMQADAPVELGNTNVLADATEIFEKIRQDAKKFSLDKSELELYKEAQNIEQNARKFYLEKANEVKPQAQKDIFLKLAEEEKKHYFLLDNIIEFVSRPQRWLEDAEFYHLEEY
jgi:rubrerythrin